MASLAQKKKAKKAAAAYRAISGAPGASPAAPSKPAIRLPAKQDRRKTGLEWLRSKNKLNDRQLRVGVWYGVRFRVSALGGAHSVRVVDLLAAGGGGGAGLPPGDLEASEWIAACRLELEGARAALGFHSGLVAACDVICGQQQTPRQISDVQREAEEIENSLRIALDLVATYVDGLRKGS